jgi:uncharacterized protein YheU (UPF0270 family)
LVSPAQKFLHPVELELPAPAGLFKASPLGLFSLASLGANDKWTTVSTSYSPKTHMLVAYIPHFSVWSDVTGILKWLKDIAVCAAENLDSALGFLQCLAGDGYNELMTSVVTDILQRIVPPTCWGDLVQAGVIGAISGKSFPAAVSIFEAAFDGNNACTGQTGGGGQHVPVVTSISPIFGPTSGGTRVTISGSFLNRVTTVYFGSKEGRDLQVPLNVNNSLTITAPAGVAGSVDVRATSGDGLSAFSSDGVYTYVAPGGIPPPPPPPPPTGSISIGWGSNPAPSGDWFDITFTNFPTGTVSWYCVEEGTAYGPYSTSLSSSTETLTTNTCYDTESGGSDYVVADGVSSNTISPDISPPPPPGSISIGWGSNPAPSGDWMDITFTNFPTGTVSWYCVEEGTSYGPYSTSLSSSTETLTTNTCYDTESGGSDYVVADGVTSNTIATDAPPPPPPSPSISIGWGSNPAPYGNWMDITFSNFPTGTVSWYCVEEGTSYGPYSTSLSSSTETLTTNTCYDTEPGGSDYVVADGVSSNTIGTD